MTSHDAKPRPIDDDGHDLIIVSDFHMSEGSDRATGQWDYREDFMQDEAFERFVAYLIHEPPPPGRRWRLIILGDFIEYLQINVEGLEDVYGYRGMAVPGPYDRHRSEEEAVWKTQQVMVGHHGVFAALGRFVSAGHRITFVPGNHDIELAWPRVQDEIREGIALRIDQVGDPAFNSRIEFEPWDRVQPWRVG